MDKSQQLRQIEEWIEKVPKPDDSALLGWETLEDFKLFLTNPSDRPGAGYSMWVVHNNGVEFPVITGGITGVNTSMVGGGEDPIEVSDEFIVELHETLMTYTQFPMENMSNRHENRFPSRFPEKQSEIEGWAIESIAGHFVYSCVKGNFNNIPYEIVWIVNECIDEMKNE